MSTFLPYLFSSLLLYGVLIYRKKDIDTGSTVESTSKHMSGLSMLLNSSDGKSGTGRVVGIVGGGGGSGGGMNLTIYLPNR